MVRVGSREDLVREQEELVEGRLEREHLDAVPPHPDAERLLHVLEQDQHHPEHRVHFQLQLLHRVAQHVALARRAAPPLTREPRRHLRSPLLRLPPARARDDLDDLRDALERRQQVPLHVRADEQHAEREHEDERDRQIDLREVALVGDHLGVVHHHVRAHRIVEDERREVARVGRLQRAVVDAVGGARDDLELGDPEHLGAGRADAREVMLEDAGRVHLGEEQRAVARRAAVAGDRARRHQ